jgi:FAD/FMN-containing dehydrogenase
MRTTSLSAFKTAFGGEIIEPGDARYDDVRSLYNAMIDKKPRVIARCRTADDAAAALAFGRDAGMLVAIRGGGHNGPGLGSCDDGLMIDLSPMKGVRVDPKARTVEAQPGCTQGEMEAVTSKHGLAVPAGIIGTTGIAGLTLGGGTGYLTRAHGLTIDNLLEADVILADSRRVTANERENADLFWALRGGGGNFGLVTRFLYRAHPVTDVYAGPLFYDAEHTREIMRWYRDWLPTAPRELAVFLGLKRVPPVDLFPKALQGRAACVLIVCFNGSPEAGEKAMAAIREELPEPLIDGMAKVPFAAWQSAFDGLLPKGRQWYWKGDFVKELTDAAIDVHIEYGTHMPSALSLMHLYPIDGAAQEPSRDATAWGARDATWSMVIAGIDPDPKNAGKISRWAKHYWAALHPHNPGGGYVNFMMGDEDGGEARLRATYGPNYDRLAAIKAKYDPENLFRVNQNIRPALASVGAK